MSFTKPAFLFSLLLLGGCAVTSTIEKVDSGKSGFNGAVYGGKTNKINTEIPRVQKHRIFHQGATGFVSVESIRQSALERATSFCSQDGNRPYLIEETTSTPPHILGNWPRIEIVFSCIKKVDSVQNKATQPDKYDQLAKLKLLFDSGAITLQEYQNEKQKLLSN